MKKKVLFGLLILAVAIIGFISGMLVEQSTDIPQPKYSQDLTVFLQNDSEVFSYPDSKFYEGKITPYDYVVVVEQPVWSPSDREYFYHIRIGYKYWFWIKESSIIRMGKGA